MIIRSERNRDFLHMSTEALKNNQISFKAKGILAYFLSKPPDWVCRVKDLQNHGTDGRHAISSALRELRKFGYAEVRPLRDKTTGKLKGKEMIIRDQSPKCGKPDFRKIRSSGNRVHTNKDSLEKKRDSSTKGGSHSFLSSGTFTSIKLSQPVLIYSEFSRRRKFHVRSEEPDKTNYFKGAGKGGWKRETLEYWEKKYRLIRKTVSRKSFLATLQWYIENYDDVFTPKTNTLSGYIDNYPKILQAKKRFDHHNKRNGHDLVKPRAKVIAIDADTGKELVRSEEEFGYTEEEVDRWNAAAIAEDN